MRWTQVAHRSASRRRSASQTAATGQPEDWRAFELPADQRQASGGWLNERGQPFNPKSVRSMLVG